MKIWVNTIVNNEENFVWFAIMSVIDFVDKVLIWDTGSTDKTVKIIKELKKKLGDKIDFKEVGPVDGNEFTKMRQAMLEQSNCDWIIILDGDEVWWKKSIKKLVQEIKKKGQEIDGIVVPMFMAVGDIYHYQKEEAGKYQLLGKKGHLSLRAVNKTIPGLYVGKPYGSEGYFDESNQPIQERKQIMFLDAPYLHTSHLKRSPQKRKYDKFKYELGRPFPDNFKYPEALSEPYPKLVSSPWVRISGMDFLKAKVLTPLRQMKRRLV